MTLQHIIRMGSLIGIGVFINKNTFEGRGGSLIPKGALIGRRVLNQIITVQVHPLKLLVMKVLLKKLAKSHFRHFYCYHTKRVACLHVHVVKPNYQLKFSTRGFQPKKICLCFSCLLVLFIHKVCCPTEWILHTFLLRLLSLFC